MPYLGTLGLHLDERALEELLNTPEGPVGQMLRDLSEELARRARVRVPIRKGRGGNSRPPGFTLASIRPYEGYDRGHIYGGANAAADPTIFLEYPAEQIRQKEPFLTDALWSLEGQI